MAKVTISGENLVVQMTGWQMVWAFRRRIVVPLDHVAEANVGDGIRKWPIGIRAGGTFLPGVITAGHYWKWGGHWEFWSVRDKARIVEIVLRDAFYQRLVVEVDDPDATASMIRQAIRPYR